MNITNPRINALRLSAARHPRIIARLALYVPGAAYQVWSGWVWMTRGTESFKRRTPTACQLEAVRFFQRCGCDPMRFLDACTETTP